MLEKVKRGSDCLGRQTNFLVRDVPELRCHLQTLEGLGEACKQLASYLHMLSDKFDMDGIMDILKDVQVNESLCIK